MLKYLNRYRYGHWNYLTEISFPSSFCVYFSAIHLVERQPITFPQMYSDLSVFGRKASNGRTSLNSNPGEDNRRSQQYITCHAQCKKVTNKMCGEQGMVHPEADISICVCFFYLYTYLNE